MSVLVDTSVWSLALRRRRRDLSSGERAIVFRCRDLAIAGETCLIGPILQETLSGIVDPGVFEDIRERLLLVEELPLNSDAFVLAAEFYNTCRAAGIAATPVDMMICAASHVHATPILTTDPDFLHYAKHLPIALHRV
jgi:predicted nucleic acid-binding protein